MGGLYIYLPFFGINAGKSTGPMEYFEATVMPWLLNIVPHCSHVGQADKIFWGSHMYIGTDVSCSIL